MSWHRNALVGLLACFGTLGLPAAHAAPAQPKLALTGIDRAPKEGREKPTAAKLAELRKAITEAPEDRGKRFDLVRALMAKGDLAEALKEAQAWRAKDAYNLVVVRLIGDIYAELGDKEKARRAYSAVVELVPKDAEAQRALATVLKQGGDLEGAHARLVAASKISVDDQRIVFELADVAHRLGRVDEAMQRFESIVASDKAGEAVRYPAKQRLAQIYAAKRRAALEKKDPASLLEAKKLQGAIDKLEIKGGSVNDIKVYLSWDTDRTDVDLWVEVPGGEKVFYGAKEAKTGEALFDDVTNGYGPESFTASKARPGTYLVKVNYFGTGRTVFTEARGEVVIILHEGTAEEERHVLPYQLFAPKQTVTVAKIEVHS
jgi:Flp pilus assembly protein TadD